ncbi:hypothetical protein SAMN05192529_102146 [Arachidicoccus rhizosphaerae]|uniref:Uncharacterized protein n=1 Tax=Arachidicoccus rhizosphaerae TaxID=551991 RepID=A0A1H3W5L4_9BACT|nr:hypothetical protein [Arachidicoccus rhizosphaerae]SDZ82280.1 hypothetical protein SAMN05192529_102146 [Arachidicoccus rhizosphaerae]
MSGGSYNYLCDQDVCYPGYGDIKDMIARLKQLGGEKPAKDAKKAINMLRKAEDILGKLSPVFKSVEWYDSNDWGIDSVKEAISEYNKINHP